jgi:Dolichyl-phosphate-mannose-protein mannosyltransferase
MTQPDAPAPTRGLTGVAEAPRVAELPPAAAHRPTRAAGRATRTADWPPARRMPTAAARVPTGTADLPPGVVAWPGAAAGQPGRWQRLAEGPWLLLVILAVQAVLALRLVWSNTAFSDEALYLWAGHLEWAHWLHGERIPGFPFYFSGDPAVYPPIGALADSVGGLAGARILSLGFMLGATCFLWATASRLVNRYAGLLAAALWAPLGPTLHLSALATFDAMAVAMMALGAWCAVRAAQRRSSAAWAIAAGAAIGVANLAAYSYAIFDPVILAVAVVAGIPRAGFRQTLVRAFEIVMCAAIVIIGVAGGGGYLQGAVHTVLNRAVGNSPASLILTQSGEWAGAVFALAALALLLCLVSTRRRRHLMLMAVLVGAAAVAPLEQLHVHTATSLDKHVDAGAWFAAIAAGYLLAELCRALRPAAVRVTAGCLAVLALAVLAAVGTAQASVLYDWANVSRFVTVFRPLVEHTKGPILVDGPSPVRYYLGTSIPWQRWSSMFSVMLPSGKSVGIASGTMTSGQPAVYLRLVNNGFFTLVALDFHTGLDNQVIAAMKASGDYRFVTQVRYGPGRYVIWERKR